MNANDPIDTDFTNLRGDLGLVNLGNEVRVQTDSLGLKNVDRCRLRKLKQMDLFLLAK